MKGNSVKNMLLIPCVAKVEVEWRNDLFRKYTVRLTKIIVPL